MPEEIKGHCVKCKAERVIKNVEISWAAGRRVAKGKCPICGATITRFLEKHVR